MLGVLNMKKLNSFKNCLERLRNSGVFSVDCVAIGVLLFGTLITGIGFFFGKTCSAHTLRFLFVATTLFIAFLSLKKAIKFVLLIFVCSVLTMYTFSYVCSDAAEYHFPLQSLLIEGWNPVFCSTPEKLASFANTDQFHIYHALFLPKLNALCGALVALALGMFVGDAFLNYLLLIILVCVGIRFAKLEWNSNSFLAIVFGVACGFSTKITAFIVGYVDYLVYASFMLALLSGYLWWKFSNIRDLIMFFEAIIICMLSKFTGLIDGVLLCLIAALLCFKRVVFWRGLIVSIIVVIIIGANPFLTSWIQYGSPIYPCMSFDPSAPICDITADFTANADGAQMGYLSRIMYAWVSPSLATKMCSWLYSNPNFSPEFYVSGGVCGMGTSFRILLLFSVVAVLLSRKNHITLGIIFLFVVSNFAPLKYIGYSRYFPQIWMIPVLAAFNLWYSPVKFIDHIKLVSRLRVFGIVLIGLISLFTVVRGVAYQCRELAVESLRQRAFEELKHSSIMWRCGEIGNTHGYSYAKRAMIAGVNLCVDEALSRIEWDKEEMFIPYNSTGKHISEYQRWFHLCNTLQDLIKFNWLEFFNVNMPHPLFR